MDPESAVLQSLISLLLYIFHFIHSFFLFLSFSRLLFRYQLFLQVKQDVLQGRLPISFELAAELGAYIIQCK